MIYELSLFCTSAILLIYGTVQYKVYNLSKIALSVHILRLLIIELIALIGYYCFYLNVSDFNFIFLTRLGLTGLTLCYLISLYWQLQSRFYLAKTLVNKPCIPHVKFNTSQTIGIFYLFTKTVTYEFYLLIIILLNCFILLISSSTYITFYLSFELVSLVIYLLISLKRTKQNIEAVIRYFFFGLLSSTLLLWGISFIHTASTFIQFNPIRELWLLTPMYKTELVVGYIFLFCAFFIKLGAFPYHFWVIKVYTNLSNITHLLMITLVNTGFLFSFLQLLGNSLPFLMCEITLFTTIFTVISLSTVSLGSLLLLTQTTFKGFLASNSILNTGFILLGYISLINIDVSSTQSQLIWLLFYYILIYNCLIFILFNGWLALGLWNIKNKISQNNNIISQYTKITVLSPQLIKIKIHVMKRIKQTFNLLTFLIHTQQQLKKVKYPPLTYLINLRYILISIYHDYNFFIFIWIIWGFPPFLVFLLKFYICVYIFYSGLLFSGLLFLLITNILVTLGLIRVLTLSIITIKYKQL